ncbi:MAG: response regulator [Tateyamaria sp.]|jgi:DNA-binding response OmpR family regulator|nr:response regulator [Tateyamaria sp.]MDG1181271.1 response regulator [Tateyamaria sp.]
MSVLIVESRPELGRLWKRHLERQGKTVDLVSGEEEAIAYLSEHDTDMIVLDLVLEDGSALTVSDFANYRRPNARVIFVTDTTFFSDGSIFNHASNACAFVPSGTPPDDLAAMVDYYAMS